MNAAQTYHRARALQKLGRTAEATPLLQELVRSALQSLQNADTAPSSGNPRQARQSRLLMGHYAAALGHIGLGQTREAKDELNQALAINPAHAGVRAALASVDRP